MVSPVTEQMMLMLVRHSGDMFVSFKLRSRRGKQIDVHPIRSIVAATVGPEIRRDMGVHSKRMRW
jgi:hypothetical protein